MLPFILTLSSTNVVPSGIVSFTSALVGAFPSVLSKWIVYVISSPSVTVLPFAGFDVLLYFKSALFTIVVTSFVGSSELSGFPGSLFTVPVFAIVFVRLSPSNGFTVTSKLTVTSPGVVPFILAGTFTSIPFARSVSVLLVKSIVSSFKVYDELSFIFPLKYA